MSREILLNGFHRSAREAGLAGGSERIGEPNRRRAFTVTLILVAFAGMTACKSDTSKGRARRWIACTCSYISDFDEPGRAPIDVCTEARDAEEVAASCVRNDGVGIPTSCTCEGVSKGPCEKSDRCRQVSQ